MGAETFHVQDFGPNTPEGAATAFQALRESALWNYGHAGYTGTIAEKDAFAIFECPVGQTPDTVFDVICRLPGDGALIDRLGPLGPEMAMVFDDKWGSAVAIWCDEVWHFMGRASS